MLQRIIIEHSVNTTPEEQLQKRLAPLLADGFVVTSATSAIAPAAVDNGNLVYKPQAKLLYFVTTVILQKS